MNDWHETYERAVSRYGAESPEVERLLAGTQCQWYLLCENAATQVRSHPILGNVPICDRCEAKSAALEADTRR